MSETIISPNNIYELRLPNGYKFEENEGVVVVYDDKNGNGAISITNYQIPDDYVFNAEEELKDFVISVDDSVDSQALQVIAINICHAHCEFIAEERFWKVWVFFKRPYAVFASYNCDEKDKGNSILEIDRIMQSLKIFTR